MGRRGATIGGDLSERQRAAVTVVVTIATALAPMLGAVAVAGAPSTADGDLEASVSAGAGPAEVTADPSAGPVDGDAPAPRTSANGSASTTGAPVRSARSPERAGHAADAVAGTGAVRAGTATAGNGSGAGALGTASADGATVYFGSGTAEVLSDQPKFYAVDAATGAERWNRSVEGDVVTGPTAVNGTVYVTTGSIVGGELLAIDAASGTQSWSRGSSSPLSSPTIVNGTVYVTGEFEDDPFVPGGGKGLYALDATDGSREWRFTAGDLLSTPAVVNGTAYFAVENVSFSGGGRTLYAVDAATGTERWNASLPGGGLGVEAPTATDDTVYLGLSVSEGGGGDENGRLYAFNASDGTRKWRFSIASGVTTPPTVVDGSVYVGSAFETFESTGRLYAVDAENGTERWSRRVGGGASGPTVSNETVYTANTSAVYAFDAVSGRTQWTYTVPEGIGSSDGRERDRLRGVRHVRARKRAVRARRRDGDASLALRNPRGGALGPDGPRGPRGRAEHRLAGTAGDPRTPRRLGAPAVPGRTDADRRGQSHDHPATGHRRPADRPHRDRRPAGGAGRRLPVGVRRRDHRDRPPGDPHVRRRRRVQRHRRDRAGRGDGRGREPDGRGDRPGDNRADGPRRPDRSARTVTERPPGEQDRHRHRRRPRRDRPGRLRGRRRQLRRLRRERRVDRCRPAVAVLARDRRDGAGGRHRRGDRRGHPRAGRRRRRRRDPVHHQQRRRRVGVDAVAVRTAARGSAGPRRVHVRGRVAAVVRARFGYLPRQPRCLRIRTRRRVRHDHLPRAGERPTDRGGSGQLTIPSPPVAAKFSGQVTARNRPDGGARFEVDLVRSRVNARIGLFRKFDLLSFRGTGFSAELFFGPAARLGLTYDETGFPANPSSANLRVALEIAGGFNVDLAAARIVGRASGQGFTQESIGSLSDIVDIANNEFGARLVVRARVEVPIVLISQRFTERFRFGSFPESNALAEAGTDGTVRYRRHEGTVPLADGLRLETAGADAVRQSTSAETGTRTDRVTRLTEDGYADESPALTATADGYLLSWNRQPPDRTVPEGHDIYVRAADATGTFGQSVRVTNDSRVDFAADLTTDGSGGAVLAWTRLNRSFTDTDNASALLNRTFAAQEIAVARAPAAGGARAPRNWTAPRLLTDAPGAAFRPRVDHGAGRIRLVWQYDADGAFRSRADRGVRYASYDATNGSLGSVTTIQGAVEPRLAGARLAYFRPDTPGGENGTVVVRNLTTGTERSARVTGFEGLSITAETAVWVAGDGPRERVRYRRADGSVGTVPTPNASGINDLELVSRQAADGRRVDALVFDARSLGEPTAGADTVSYRVRQGDSWGSSRPLTAAGTDLTFLDVTAAGREGGFLSAVAAENVSAPAEQPDLFAVRHGYAADLNVSATVPSGLAPGESARIEWAVRNEGGATARNVTVTVESADGSVLASAGAGTIPPGARASGIVLTTVPRSPTLTVSAGDDASTTRPDETTLRILRPDLELESIERTPAPGGVAYTVTVRNTGPVAAREVAPAITSNGRRVANASVGTLGPDASATVRLVAPTNRTTAGLVTRVRADPGDRIEEGDETTGTRRVAPPRPDLFVTEVGTRATVDVSTGAGRINVTIGNRGVAGATATVRVTAGNRSVNRTVSLAGTRANATRFRTVRFAPDALALSAGQSVTVAVRPRTLDARPTDNVARTTVRRLGRSPNGSGPGRLPGQPAPANDPDGDGDYEDVNGDGEFTVLDVAIFLDIFDRIPSGDAAAVNFDGKSGINILDVTALLFET